MLMQVFLFLLGLTGAVLVSIGAFIYSTGLGFIVSGGFCLCISYLYTRQLAYQQVAPTQKAES